MVCKGLFFRNKKKKVTKGKEIEKAENMRNILNEVKLRGGNLTCFENSLLSGLFARFKKFWLKKNLSYFNEL